MGRGRQGIRAREDFPRKEEQDRKRGRTVDEKKEEYRCKKTKRIRGHKVQER